MMARKRDQQGQMTIEMMLIIVALLTIGLMVSKTAKQDKWMATIVSGPWKPLQGMIEDGEWNGKDSKNYHPNLLNRHGSLSADRVE